MGSVNSRVPIGQRQEERVRVWPIVNLLVGAVDSGG